VKIASLLFLVLLAGCKSAQQKDFDAQCSALEQTLTDMAAHQEDASFDLKRAFAVLRLEHLQDTYRANSQYQRDKFVDEANDMRRLDEVQLWYQVGRYREAVTSFNKAEAEYERNLYCIPPSLVGRKTIGSYGTK
jgi:tetratricopeptide (TPR) repeat protein